MVEAPGATDVAQRASGVANYDVINNTRTATVVKLLESRAPSTYTEVRSHSVTLTHHSAAPCIMCFRGCAR